MACLAKIAARLAKSAAIPYSALAAQIQRQTIKVWHISYQNAVHQFDKLVSFFLTHTVYSIIIIIIWTLQHSVACDDIKIVVKVAERNADRQHQNRVVKLRTIYM